MAKKRTRPNVQGYFNDEEKYIVEINNDVPLKGMHYGIAIAYSDGGEAVVELQDNSGTLITISVDQFIQTLVEVRERFHTSEGEFIG